MRVALTLTGAGSDLSLRLLVTLMVCCAHGLVWASASALLVRWSSPRPSRAHALWKLALLGPLCTTGLSFVGAVGHAGGFEARTDVASQISGAPTRAAAASLRWAVGHARVLDIAAVLCAAVTALVLARLAIAACALRRALRDRRAVHDPRLVARFAALRTRAGLPRAVLSESVHVPGPLVVGRREVCLPRGALADFGDDEVDAVLAHELAHLGRADGLWFPLIALIEAVLWMQSAGRWLAARCRHTAELAADDRAVALTGSALSLARAITRIAAAQRAQPHTCLAPSMAAASVRVERVRRLVTLDLQAVHPADAVALAAAPRCALGLLALIVPSLMRVELVAPLHAAQRAPQPAAPDVAAHRAQTRSLARRVEELERALAAAEAESTPYPAALLELEQDLRHARAMLAWTAARVAQQPADSGRPTLEGAPSP